MIPRERETLLRKLGYLKKNVDLLAEYRTLTQDELFASSEKTFAVERLLQTAIESVIDCSRLLVGMEDWRGIRDERDALIILGERDVLPPWLVEKLMKAKGLRNILVHEYATLDHSILYTCLRDGIADLRSFAVALARWLESQA